MKARYEDKIPKKESEVELGTLYDVNKQLMQNLTPLSDDQLTESVHALNDWLQKSEAKYHSKYYMLLCNERKDYTLFNLDKTSTLKKASATNCLSAAADAIDCMSNRGDIIAIDYQEDTDAWEIWIRTIDDQNCAYYFFPYGQAVLEY